MDKFETNRKGLKLFCEKYQLYFYDGVDCKDPNLFCKFRTRCLIWATKPKKLADSEDKELNREQ